MRVLVTGSRRWVNPQVVHDALLWAWYDAVQDGADGITVVHGTAQGADTIADEWARTHEPFGVKRDPHPADWSGPCGADCQPGHRRERRDGSDYCPLAGHRRNQHMVNLGAAIVLAFQQSGSTGTADCIRRAESAGIHVQLFTA